MNKESLAYQMQEKDAQKKMKEIADKQYAEDVKNKVLTEQQREQMKIEEAKSRQREYCNSLSRQMEESKVKRKYNELMTEHERRVNDKDIKAYEVMDTKAIHSKIPGIKSHDQDLKDRYLEKMFSSNSTMNLPTGLVQANGGFGNMNTLQTPGSIGQ